MRGIEPEIMEGFKKYLHDTYGVRLQITWKEGTSFGDIYALIKNKKEEGTFAISAFSITPERQREVAFSPPYMSDISVMIASKNIPIVGNAEEFDSVFSNLTAVTIQGTTYEQDLLKLKEGGNLPFTISYIPSSQNILRTIEKMDNAFGFIDLPVYMMIFNENPSVNVKRQNLFPVKRQGYAFIFPTGSDWASPLAGYFSDEQFKSALETIIGKYIDIDLYRFVESLAIQSNDPVILLTKEKEIQHRDIIGKAEQLLQETRRKNFLIVLLVFIIASLALIFYLYRKRNEQKEKIEAQNKSIALKSEQLELRNQHLVALDEEKNNLIKILAHDLRTPINHMQGLAQLFLLSNPALQEDQKMIIKNITDASIRLNKMITNILDIDTLENSRVTVFMDEVTISALVNQVVQSFDKLAAKKNITLLFTTANEKSSIQGDPLFLIQVFENLLSNAIKFSDKGGPVETSIVELNGKVRISVQDQGPGLTEEDLQKVFKKFQRLSAQPTGGEGSLGLGLSIVKKYVELMGGRVVCESRPRHGATFTVEFNKI
jgi:signal transduction histidine kinase